MTGPITAAGRHGGHSVPGSAGYRYKHGWILVDGKGKEVGTRGGDDDLVDVTDRPGNGGGGKGGSGGGVNSHLDRLRDRRPGGGKGSREEQLASMSGGELKAAHEHARTEHARTNSPSAKREIAEVAGAIKREHQARKAKAGAPVDVTARANGGDGIGKGRGDGGNAHVDVLRDRPTTGKHTKATHAASMTTAELKATHAAAREQHGASNSPSTKAALSEVGKVIRDELARRKGSN